MVSATTVLDVRSVVAGLPDPELPMITIGDLGILRDVDVDDSGRVVVTITPTYSGCPAMDAIRADIVTTLAEHGLDPDTVVVETVLAPAWTTDWVTPAGREALRRHGIAPPSPAGPTPIRLSVRCPRCGSPDTRELSRFGSTACKALWVCTVCQEPFDHLKAL